VGKLLGCLGRVALGLFVLTAVLVYLAPKREAIPIVEPAPPAASTPAPAPAPIAKPAPAEESPRYRPATSQPKAGPEVVSGEHNDKPRKAGEPSPEYRAALQKTIEIRKARAAAGARRKADGQAKLDAAIGEMDRADAAARSASAMPPSPLQTGPRGGVYTVGPDGRKNYQPRP
jgi:hypothetical protein